MGIVAGSTYNDASHIDKATLGLAVANNDKKRQQRALTELERHGLIRCFANHVTLLATATVPVGRMVRIRR
jgi:ABC-type metal ion transport system substrate-binding protein